MSLGSTSLGTVTFSGTEASGVDLGLSNSVQANSAAVAVITQAHDLLAALFVQGSVVSSAALTQDHVLSISTSTQTQSVAPTLITQTQQLVAALLNQLSSLATAVAVVTSNVVRAQYSKVNLVSPHRLTTLNRPRLETLNSIRRDSDLQSSQ